MLRYPIDTNVFLFPFTPCG